MDTLFFKKIIKQPYSFIFLCIIGSFLLYGAKNIWSKPKNTSNCIRCNIVLIVIDPLRADELPCYGYILNTTPNICRFAQNNTMFTNTFSQSSWTLPSIMSLFSSQYPTQHNVFIPDVDVLPAALTTLPMSLKNSGYKTVFIGPINEATHHVPLNKGIGRGFDQTIPYTSLSDAAKTLKQLLEFPTPNKPVFVFIHSFDLRNDSIKAAPTVFPLDPYYTYGNVDPYLRDITILTQESKANITSYRRIYDERLRQLDEQFQAVIQSIFDTDIRNNTIIALTSDHGEEFGEHGQSTHGLNVYKTVTHVPFILSVPYQKPRIINTLTQSIDIYPTLLGVVGITPPNTVRGIHAFSNAQTRNSYAISQLEPEKKLVGIRTPQWSYHFDPTSPLTQKEGKLYKLDIDPNERTDVASSHGDIVDQLIRVYNHQISL